jgi:hypothetical protein
MRFVIALFVLSACVAVPRASQMPDPAARLAAECALLAEAAQRMGPDARPGLLEGCPGTTARDTRPLPQQLASLRAAQAAPLPAGIAPQTRADTVFRRLITRGVPVSIAISLSDDPRFQTAAR